jgi:chromosomal replication initiator protein
MTPYVAVGVPQPVLRKYLADNIAKDDSDLFGKIMVVVCNIYKIPINDIVSKSRKRNVVEPRQIIMYLLTKYTTLSLVSIGRLFNYDHSTVIYSRDTVKDMMDVDALFAAKINQMENMI